MIDIKLLEDDRKTIHKPGMRRFDSIVTPENYPVKALFKYTWDLRPEPAIKKLRKGKPVLKDGVQELTEAYYIEGGQPSMAGILYEKYIYNDKFPTLKEFLNDVRERFADEETSIRCHTEMAKARLIGHEKEYTYPERYKLVSWRACSFINSKLKELGIGYAIDTMTSQRFELTWSLKQDTAFGVDLKIKHKGKTLSNVNVTAGKGGLSTSEERVISRNDVKDVKIAYQKSGDAFIKREGTFDVIPKAEMAVRMNDRKMGIMNYCLSLQEMANAEDNIESNVG